MADIFSKTKRSEVMSRIRSHGNKKTEGVFARLLRANGIAGWRRRSLLFGKPDFAFHKLRVAVFVDGCFWHACPKHGSRPANNRAFWQKKLAANIARDRRVTRELRKTGWRVLRIWEHELTRKNAARLLRRIRRTLT